MQGAGFRVQGSGCRVQSAGCRVQGSEFRVQGVGLTVSMTSTSSALIAGQSGCVHNRKIPDLGAGFGVWVQDSGFRVQGSGVRVQGSGVRVQGSGLRVSNTAAASTAGRSLHRSSGFEVQVYLAHKKQRPARILQ
jgi:hypothetical protein